MAYVGRVLSGKARLSFGMHRIGGCRETGDADCPPRDPFLTERSPVEPRVTAGGGTEFCATAGEGWPPGICTPKICLPWFQEAPRVKWTDQEEGLGHLDNPSPCARGYPPDEGATACAARNEN